MPPSIETELAELRAHGLLRQLREVDSPQQPSMEFAGKKLLNFSSNDYLGLATEPVLREAASWPSISMASARERRGSFVARSHRMCGSRRGWRNSSAPRRR